MEASKELLSYFAKLYLQNTGEKYIYNWGRDLKLFSLLLNDIDSDKLKRLLDLYFKTKTKIFSIVFFKSSINELNQLLPKEEKPRERLINPDEWRFL